MLAASACGAEVKTPEPLSVEAAASTLVALTFEAATQTASASTPTPLPSPIPTPTTQPILYITDNAKCRTGPGGNFKVIAVLSPGTIVELIGRSTAQSAWLVVIPEDHQTCWLQAQDASPGGSYESLPEVTPQPSTQKPPSIPGPISWPYLCLYAHGVIYKVTVGLSWINSAGDANGFRLYRQDTLIADLPADTTNFTDTIEVPLGTQLTYSVEAYNDVGVSPRQKITTNPLCKQ